ncbi:MAG: HIT family protein [Butyrivibrio sp.]|uniref:HIT family protein n=1 Tax=Butyrivibrio sp. TaxID=28121 RepID=UPI001B727531|nr:HIT family protein [Butyrivibrio sp.]MBP3280512.1 HIT family protein [Butyrivibrio sp.]MBP3782508.1 HIT family protein [Butyrivibrio sp.]
MDSCIFCKIANGEIPSNTIYEDDKFRVILDNGPATKGHALVIPKEHYANLFEMPQDLLADAAVVAKKVATNIKEKLSCDGLNLVQNNGETAGQTVMHFHLHIIPRYENDGQHILWNPTSPSAEELVEVKNTIVGA